MENASAEPRDTSGNPASQHAVSAAPAAHATGEWRKLQIANKAVDTAGSIRANSKATTFSRWNQMPIGDGWKTLIAWIKVWNNGCDQDYTVSHMEKEIYDNRMPLDVGLVPVDRREEAPQNLIRFTASSAGSELAYYVDIITIMVVFIGSIVTPVTFMWRGSWNRVELVPGGSRTLLFELVLDVIYASQLALRFNRSYMHPIRRVEVVNRKKIRNHLLGSPSYIIEWISVVSPYMWFVDLEKLPLMQLVKIVRIVNLIDLPVSLWALEDRIWVRLGRPLLLLMIGSHWVACLLSCVGNFRSKLDHDSEHGFWTQGPDMHDATNGFVSVYLLAFIEGLYMLSGALDNPVGAEDSLRGGEFGIQVMVALFGPIGCILVSVLIAVIMREVSLATALDSHHEEKKAFIERALANLNISSSLQRRVFSQHAFQQMSHDYEAFGALFNRKSVSTPLSCALKVYLYNDSILQGQFFVDKNRKAKNHSYILEVVRVLEDHTFVPGDYVTRRGEVGAEMYFVGRGELSVLVPDKLAPTDVGQAVRVNTMYKGGYFGEVALIKESLRTAWIMAETYALLSCLTRDAISNIWLFFPEEKAELQAKVLAVLENDRKRQREKAEEDAVRKIPTMEQPPDEEDPDLVHSRLKVTVHRANNLRNADWQLLGGGKSDPFCTVQIDDSTDGLITTHVVNDTIDPEWEYFGFFPNYLKGRALVFKVWDEDDTAKDFLGQAALTSDRFLPDGCAELCLPLLQDGNTGKSTLTVSVNVMRGGMQAAVLASKDTSFIGEKSREASKEQASTDARSPKHCNEAAGKQPPQQLSRALPKYDPTTAHNKKRCSRLDAAYCGDSMKYLELLCTQAVEGHHRLRQTCQDLLRRQSRLEQRVEKRLQVHVLPEPALASPAGKRQQERKSTKKKSKKGLKKKDGSDESLLPEEGTPNGDSPKIDSVPACGGANGIQATILSD